MGVRLEDYQKDALRNLNSGCILAGGVGTGKSIVAIYWYLIRFCGCKIGKDTKGLDTFQPAKGSPNLFIITTPKKRDSLEWNKELSRFGLYPGENKFMGGIRITVDSWNNITKYADEPGSVFIFDEQRVVGWGTWSKTFVTIARNSAWILLSATPGDTWSDYIPVFIANGFYKNKSQFERRHAVYSRFTKYPKIDRWLEEDHLRALRRKILVPMEKPKQNKRELHEVVVGYDKADYQIIRRNRKNIFTGKPIKNYSEMAMCSRRLVNTDTRRLEEEAKIIKQHPRVIIFYNLTAELDGLRDLGKQLHIPTAEWNGENHDPLPKGRTWIYLVQYTAGAEGWNCVTTDTVIFHSLNYSYKIMEQAAGRIDRMNTPYSVLHYYLLRSMSPIDLGIMRALRNKKKFNAIAFFKGKKKPTAKEHS